jgi:LmbE family N-acetylglucosaminyl deacetylase
VSTQAFRFSLGCVLFRLVLVLGSAAAGFGCAQKEQATELLEIGENERLLVIAPHPDDETLGAGGLMQAVLARHGTVRVTAVTPGDGYVEAVEMVTRELRPRPAEFIAYGEKRAQELRAAVQTLSKGRARVEDLGFPDGGLPALLNQYWSRAHPERSATTGESKVYLPRSPDLGAAYDGAELKHQLLRIIAETAPTLVVIPDPLDRHPDHSATALFSILALDEWARETGRLGSEPRAPLPRLLAYLVHWPHWPPGQGASQASWMPQAAALELPADLPDRGYRRVILPLRRLQVERKAAALRRYATQQAVMGAFLSSFERRTEPFSVLSSYDLESVDSSVEQEIARALERAQEKQPATSP